VKLDDEVALTDSPERGAWMRAITHQQRLPAVAMSVDAWRALLKTP